ncbi:MAG: TRAP transporter small permease subunit [Cyclobacteriaceae bacterium]
MREKLLIILEKLLIVLVATMTVDVLWQVASRYILENPSNFTDELAGFLLIWLGLFGAAYASGKEIHVAIDILPKQLRGKNKIRIYQLGRLFVALFALSTMTIGGSNLVYLTFLLDQRSASLEIPLGYVYSCIPICGLLITYFAIHSMLTPQKIADGLH